MQSRDKGKSALIIQGPIVSRGNTGRGLGLKNLFVDDIEFDATSCINENIRKSETVFDLIIISTWEGENTSGIEGSEKVKIIKSNVNLLEKQHPYGSNKHRQFYTIQKALEVAEQNNCFYIVKIRTDTQIDSDKMLQLIQKMPEKIWVVAHEKPNFLYDFYVAGNLPNVLHLVDAILRKRSLYIRIHEDLFYGYLYKRSSPWVRIQLWNFYPRDRFLTLAQASLINTAWERYFSHIPQELWNETVWRGYGIPREFHLNSEYQVEKLNEWLSTQQKQPKSFIKFSVRNIFLFLVRSTKRARLTRKH